MDLLLAPSRLHFSVSLYSAVSVCAFAVSSVVFRHKLQKMAGKIGFRRFAFYEESSRRLSGSDTFMTTESFPKFFSQVLVSG